MDTPQPESNPSQQFGEDEDQTLLFPGYSDVPGAGMDYQVQDEEHLAPGSQNGTFAPGSQDGTFTPGSQDGTFAPGSQDGTFSLGSQDGTFAPGADGTKKSISDKETYETHRHFRSKELSLGDKLKLSFSYNFATSYCKPLIFQT